MDPRLDNACRHLISSRSALAAARFYREVEIKHGRVSMLAAVGFVVQEVFHPLFGGDIDVPSIIAFQETPLQLFWPLVVLFIAVPEIFSVFSFQSPFGGEPWAIRLDHNPGLPRRSRVRTTGNHHLPLVHQPT